ncbi:MAG: TolC family protein, partial [Proteobacteria bacterium]|nr:TolC family protein [Pseudomonadota bacterium]
IGTPLGVEQIIARYGKLFGVTMEVLVLSPTDFEKRIGELETDLVFVSDLYGFTAAQTEKVFAGFAARKVPAFSAQGVFGVERGALAAFGNMDIEEAGRTCASEIYSILSGTKPSEISIYDKRDTELVLNRDVASQIGFDIPIHLELESRIVEQRNQRREFTLRQAIERGMTENREVLIDNLERQQIDLQVKKASTAFLPQITGYLTHTEIPETGSEGTIRVEIGQSLYNPEAIASIRLADHNRLLAVDNSKLAMDGLKERIIAAFLNLERIERVVESRKTELRNYRKLEKTAQLRFELRETGKSDVLMVAMEYKNAQYEMIDAMEELAMARLDFNDLLGLDTELRVTAKPIMFSFRIFKQNRDFFWKFLNARQHVALRKFLTLKTLENSLGLKLSEAQLQAARLEKDLVRSRFLPTFQMGFSWSEQQYLHSDFSSEEEERYNQTNEGDWSAQFEVKVPIFSGGIRFKEAGEAELKVRTMAVQLEKDRSDLVLQTRKGFDACRMNFNRVLKLQSILADSRENLELGRLSYLEGNISIMDLLDLQSRVVNNEISLTIVQYQYYRSLVNLLRSIGKIDMAWMGLRHPQSIVFLKEMETYVRTY